MAAQRGGEQSKFPATISLYGACSKDILVQRGLGYWSESDTIGCVWTGEFDLNTLRVDREIFESGKKKLRIQNYPDTCGRGLNRCHQLYPPTNGPLPDQLDLANNIDGPRTERFD